MGGKKGWNLIFLFLLIWMFLFWAIGISKVLFNTNIYGPVFGLIVGIILAAVAYRNQDRILLKAANATKLNPGKYPDLYDAVKMHAAKYHIPIPEMYLNPDVLPNFHVFGTSLDKMTIVFTRGFLDQANPAHLIAAIAWAVVSAKRGSLQDKTLGSALAYMLMSPSKFADLFNFGSVARYNFLHLILLLPFAPFAAMLVKFAGGKTNIYQIDRATTDLTGDPGYLVVTLIEIDKQMLNLVLDVDLATVPLFIAPPKCINVYYMLFRPFPPIGKRINRLRMQRKQVLNKK